MIKHILLTVAATLLCICRIDAQYRLNMDSIINESIRIVTKDIISKNPEYAEYGRIVLTDYTLPPSFCLYGCNKYFATSNVINS